MGFKEFVGKISDAIPNEFSKLNSVSKFLPAPFNLLVQAPAALDRFGETYSSGGSFMDSMGYGASAFLGTSGDPNKYSPKMANPYASKDPFLMGGSFLDSFTPGAEMPWTPDPLMIEGILNRKRPNSEPMPYSDFQPYYQQPQYFPQQYSEVQPFYGTGR